MRWHLNVLSHPTSDSGPSFLFKWETAALLFEAPENLSRLCTQQRQSLRKVNGLFVSSLKGSHGLHGTIMNLDAAGKRDLDLYGPPNLDHYMACARFHLRRSNCAFAVHSPEEDAHDKPVYKDSNVSVYAFLLASETPRTLKRKRSDSPVRSLLPAKNPASLQGAEANAWISAVHTDMFQSASKSWADGPTPAYTPASLPAPTRPSDVHVAWLGVTAPIRGKFLPQKALALGVPKGPAFGKLAQGESVDTSAGLVRPEQCMAPGEPPTAFLVLNVTLQHLKALMTQAQHIKSLLADHAASLRTIIHHVDLAVLRDPVYQAWMHTFDPDVAHLLCNKDLSPDTITMTSSFLLQLRLSKVDADVFKPPHYQLQSQTELSESQSVTRFRKVSVLASVKGLPASCMVAQSGYRLASHSSTKLPAAVVRRDITFQLASSEADQEASRLSDSSDAGTQEEARAIWLKYLDLVEEARAQEAGDAVDGEVPGQQLVVTTLGTGSAVPNKYRNVSATLVQDPESGLCFLLDAGEGTLGQLRRRFTPEGAAEVINSLAFVSISHMHADHHGGLSSVLSQRDQSKPLCVICPRNLATYIQDINCHEDLGLFGLNGVSFVNGDRLLPGDREGPPAAFKRMLSDHGLTSINTVLVDHRARCYGLVVTAQAGWRIAYSGDTRPSEAFVKAGIDATLLIHEATMNDDLPEAAKAKGHSTFGEALEVADRMRAKHCVLTHFSQRYPKMPTIALDRLASIPTVLAYDGMRIVVGGIARISRYLPAMSELSRELLGIAEDEG